MTSKFLHKTASTFPSPTSLERQNFTSGHLTSATTWVKIVLPRIFSVLLFDHLDFKLEIFPSDLCCCFSVSHQKMTLANDQG